MINDLQSEMTEDASDRLRPVGHLEKFYTARHHLNLYLSVIVAARYSAPEGSSCVLTHDREPLIYEVLRGVIARHPALATSIVGEGQSNPYFVRLPKLDLQSYVEFDTLDVSNLDVELRHLLEAQLTLPFRDLGVRAPWNITVAECINGDSRDLKRRSSFFVIFRFHHAMSDGLGGLSFHYSFLAELNRLQSQGLQSYSTPDDAEVIRTYDVPATLQLHPSVEQAAQLQLSIPFLVSNVWQDLRPKWWQSDTSIWTGSAAPASFPAILKTHVRFISVSPIGLQTLLTFCRTNDFSMTCLLQGVIMVSVSKVLHGNSTLLSTTAFTLRNMIGIRAEDLGTYTSSFDTRFPRELVAQSQASQGEAATRESILYAARHYKIGLRRIQTSGLKDLSISLLRYVDDFDRFFKRKLGKRRTYSFELSNLGVFSNDALQASSHGSAWDVDEICFTQCGLLNTAVGFNCASVKGKGLGITMTWQEGAVDEGLVSKIQEVLQENLRVVGGRDVLGDSLREGVESS